MAVIAERAKIPASARVGMMSMVNELKGKGVDVTSLGAGEPGYVTPPHIRESAKKALDNGYTRYSTAAGMTELREAVAEKLSRENGIDADPKSQILITVGGKEGVFLAMQALISPRDRVLLTDPSQGSQEFVANEM